MPEPHAPDPTLSPETRILAKSEWDGQPFEGEAEGAVATSGFLLSWLWRWHWLFGAFVGNREEDRGQAFIRFHGTQASAVLLLYLALRFSTCCVGFIVFLIPFVLLAIAGRRAAGNGEWRRLPLVGLLVRMPPADPGTPPPA